MLILDTEGVDGTEEHQKTIDLYVTLYSMELSTLHIVNVLRHVGAHDLDPILVSGICPLMYYLFFSFLYLLPNLL